MRILRILYLLIVLSFMGMECRAQVAMDQESVNREIYRQSFESVKENLDKPLGDLTVLIGKGFIGTPYVASTLETEPERLRIIMDKTDCILFVEMCVALALTFKGLAIEQGHDPVIVEPSYELFCNNIRSLRYRDGQVDGYASRLHYTSEWILQGERNGIFGEYTSTLGEPLLQKFSFMSTHPDSYRQMKGRPEVRARIADVERRLQDHGQFYQVPRTMVAETTVLSEIRDGDLVAFVSNVEGLDITHIGIACHIGKELHFLHASTNAMEVVLEKKTLTEYVRSGIRLIRIKP